MEFDTLTLSRVQFAMTIMFHYLFPPLSIGLAVLLVAFEWLSLRTADPDYRAEAQKTQLRVLPKTGEELQKAITAAINDVDPATIGRARGFLN